MAAQQRTGPNKKEWALDLAKFVDKKIRVKLQGGREVTGVLKGYDQMMNLVMDETIEHLRDPEDPQRVTDETRNLGLIVARGTSVMVVHPTSGVEAIKNPFAA
ncbi:unnamed protein product [Pedinophyceae sp. YPF-701]|nr:unnamed protein product [Pedinophyceae sp. YPF-701]